jgi:hypothetical protein
VVTLTGTVDNLKAKRAAEQDAKNTVGVWRVTDLLKVIGRVGEFLVDDRDWSIRYFIVQTALWFGKNVVVPTAAIREVSWDQQTVYLTIPRERIKNAPEYDVGAPRLPDYEQRLDAYFGS